MSLPERIARVLAPHLGENTADAVARHLCAKHGIGEDAVDPEKVRSLEATIRQGLVAFVGADRAAALAADCFRDPSG